MIGPLLSALVGLVGLVVVTGVAPALLLGRSRSEAAALAPAATVAACALAVAASVLSGTGMLPWLGLFAVAGWVAWWRSGQGLPDRGVGRDGDGGHDGWCLAAAALVAFVPLLLVDYPATTADARSIWWLHAAWFRSGGDLARAAMDAPVLPDIHPSYPPALPGVIAAVWILRDAYDREVALGVSQILTAYGAAALGFFTRRVLRLTGAAAVAVAGGVAWLGWSAKVEVGLSGLVDLTWALWLGAAAVLLLAGTSDRRTVAIGGLFAAVAALTKTEGQVGALLLVGVAVVRHRSAWRAWVPVGGAVLCAIGLWASVIRPGPKERGDWSLLGDLLRDGTEAHERFTVSITRVASELGPLVGLAAVTVVMLVVVGRLTGRPLRQPGLVLLLLLAAGYAMFLPVTFAIRPEPIEFLLEVTAYRAVIVVRLLVVLDLVVAAVAAARALGCLAEAPRSAVPETLDDELPAEAAPATG